MNEDLVITLTVFVVIASLIGTTIWLYKKTIPKDLRKNKQEQKK